MNLISILEDVYKQFPIYKNESLIIGSTYLSLCGIVRHLPSDIDIVLNGKSWRLMDEVYSNISSPLGNKINLHYMRLLTEDDRKELSKIHYVSNDLSSLSVEFFDSIGHDFNFKECFQRCLNIHGFRFLNLVNLRKWYDLMGREKDIWKSDLIQKYLEERMAKK